MAKATKGHCMHVDPENPTGPLLSERPDLSGRLSGQDHNRIARKVAKRRRKAQVRSKRRHTKASKATKKNT